MHVNNRQKAQITAVEVRRPTQTELQPLMQHDAGHFIKRTERLTRNFLCAVLAVVCIYAIQTADLPDSNAVQAAARSIIDVNWEENLGKIQFVSTMFPETTEVFWQMNSAPVLALKQDSQILHTWTRDEPYVAIMLPDFSPYALADGNIRLIAHDDAGQTLVSIEHDKGYETIYYGLEACSVKEDQAVYACQPLGKVGGHQIMSFELRQEGLPVDPKPFLSFGDNMP